MIAGAAIGAIIVRFLHVEFPGITTRRNSMSAVYSSGLTKLGNKTASRMSMKVIGKGFVSEFCGSMSSVDINVFVAGIIVPQVYVLIAVWLVDMGHIV